MKNKLLKIIKYYGVNHQQRKLMEEIFELQEAITLKESEQFNFYNKYHRKNIIEEMVDCMVLLSQFKEYYGISEKELQEVAKYKIIRQLERISKERG